MKQTKDIESDSETTELANPRDIKETFICGYLFIVIIWLSVMCVISILISIILNELHEKNELGDKEIIKIHYKSSNSTCTPQEPCYLTCNDVDYESEDCHFNYIIIIIAGCLLVCCSLTILCQCCKYMCGYIIYNDLHPNKNPHYEKV